MVDELSPSQKLTFGADAKLDPVTKRPLQQGQGCAPDYQQALGHCDEIEAESDKATADAMRARVRAYYERPEEVIAHDEKTRELQAQAEVLGAKKDAVDAEITVHKAKMADHAKTKPHGKATAGGPLAPGHRYMTASSERAGVPESHGEPNPLGPGERYMTEKEERAADKAETKKK